MPISHEDFENLHKLVDAKTEEEKSKVLGKLKKDIGATTSFQNTTSTSIGERHDGGMAGWQKEVDESPDGRPNSRLKKLEEKHGKQS